MTNFRVSLRKLYSIITIPKFDAFQSGAPDQQASTDFEEVLSIKWQQKEFSKSELAYYTLKENCKSDLEKRYHQLIKAMSDEERNAEGRLMFTYIDDDKYQPPDNFGPREVSVTRLRRNVETQPSVDDRKQLGMFIDSDQSFVPSRYDTGNDFVRMFIMADLEPTTLLVSITYRKSDGLFILYPDFNSIDNEYQLEIDQNSKQLYGYFIENLSSTFNEATKSAEQIEKLNKLQEETYELVRKLNILKDPDFVFPKFSRTVLMLEIIDARDFEYDNIHVQFEFKLPKFMKIVEGIVAGSTHSSFVNGETWSFGHCHSLVLDVDDEFLLSTSKVDSIKVNFEVISIDPLWERERREGLSTIKIPIGSSTDQEVFELQCFRELQGGSRLRDFLERFFLGGVHKTQLLEHKTEGIANMYGNSTISTGKLRIKVQNITQTQMSRRSHLHMKSVDEIIEAYHKAKARLES